MKEGIVLFAHGSRDPRWARPFQQLAATLSRNVKAPVKLAFLGLMRPSLDEAIASLAIAGATSIRVVPVFLGQGGHVREDLPKLVATARKKHRDIKINLERPIGEQAAVIEAIAGVIAEKNN